MIMDGKMKLWYLGKVASEAVGERKKEKVRRWHIKMIFAVIRLNNSRRLYHFISLTHINDIAMRQIAFH